MRRHPQAVSKQPGLSSHREAGAAPRLRRDEGPSPSHHPGQQAIQNFFLSSDQLQLNDLRQLRFQERGRGSEVSINGNAWGLLSQRFL